MRRLLPTLARCLASLAVLTLAACSTTGHNFDESALGTLTPGQSTLFDAKVALGGQPADIYSQGDGTSLARWAFKVSFVTDGLYHRKEAMLLFGPDGRLIRLVDTNNILLEPWQRQKLLGTGAYN
ncbi:hypothetical protein [Orrella dioscoreae]|uniref:Putative lipoprotein n=2 Tax=root TaxID=1 RepID=A0A1C3JZC9_9BURK|nr:putative lipoprotein [Orrella dioscoreae]SOE49547.1 putative lipoprotein [Orrella dioscoreae]